MGIFMPDGKQHTERLIEFITADHRFPDEVLHEAKRAFLGFYAAAFSGIASPIWASSRDAMHEISPVGAHVALGTERGWALQDAAFLNAIAGNVLDFDDTHLPTIVHPSSMVVPVLWAKAQAQPIAGLELLRAMILSFEVMCRVGNATHPDAYKRGFHVTATCGSIGAALATALLEKCSPDTLRNVIGLSANLGAGLIANLATPAKAVSVGNAVRNGMLTPVFVRAGITASPVALEGSFGFLQAMSESSQAGELVQGLGVGGGVSRWEILQVAQKPYPTGVVLNPVIDACLALREDPLCQVEKIKQIEVFGHSLLKDRADRPIVKSVPDARLSVQHTVAVCLLHGLPSVRSFHEAAFQDTVTKRLGQLVSVHVDPKIDVEGARVRLSMVDGTVFECDIQTGRWSLANPLTDKDLEDKLVKSVAESFPSYDPSSFIRSVWALDGSKDAAELFSCLPRGDVTPA
jgi:2-methylcitrate dehydratase PrpD